LSKTLTIGHKLGKTVTNIIFKISNENNAQKYEIITMKRNARNNIGDSNNIIMGGIGPSGICLPSFAIKYPRATDPSSTILPSVLI
jgi:hypothetical protein